MLSFIGTCVNNPFGKIDVLCNIIEEASEITKGEFLSSCYVDDEIIEQMDRFPNDYTYSKSGRVLFFTWSCIEHFYT